MGLVDFSKRHRRKSAVAVGSSAAVYWAVGFVGEKSRELQEKLLLDRLTREDLEKRFEQNQKDATFTTMASLPKVSVQILEYFNVEEIRHSIQELRNQESRSASSSMISSQELSEPSNNEITAPSNADETPEANTSQLNFGNSTQLDGSYVKPMSKAESWNRLKIESLARVFTLVYAAALLTLFTRIQLNILGRRSYTESMETSLLEPNSVSEAALLADEEQSDLINRQYLTFSWWLLHRGWNFLAQRVKSVVEEVTTNIEPTKRLTCAQIEEIFGEIHKKIDDQGTFVDISLPPLELETYVLSQIPGEEQIEIDPALRALLDETTDIIQSVSSTEVRQKLVHSGLTVLVQKLQPLYAAELDGTRLATALMFTTKQAHQIAAGSPLSNDYVDAMIDVPELDALSAAIYSNF